MNTTSLVAEFILIGLIPFLTVGFSILAINNIYDFRFLSQIKDYSTILIFISTMIIYLLGALTHRLAQVLSQYLWRPMLNWIMHRKKTAMKLEETYYQSALVYQFGSEKTIERIQYNDSLIRIFGATFMTIPIFAAVLSFWIYSIAGWKGVIIVIAVCAIMTFAAFLSFRMQKENSSAWLMSVIKVIEQSRKIKTTK